MLLMNKEFNSEIQAQSSCESVNRPATLPTTFIKKKKKITKYYNYPSSVGCTTD